MNDPIVNELLYRALSMTEFMGGLIAGMCLVALPVVLLWPRKTQPEDVAAEQVDPVSSSIESKHEAQETTAFAPAA